MTEKTTNLIKNNPCISCQHHGICKYEDRMADAIEGINKSVTDEFSFIKSLSIECSYMRMVTLNNFRGINDRDAGKPISIEDKIKFNLDNDPSSCRLSLYNLPDGGDAGKTIGTYGNNTVPTQTIPVINDNGEAISIKTTTKMRSGSNRSADIPEATKSIEMTEVGRPLPTENIPVEGINPNDLPPQFRDTVVSDLTTRQSDPEQTSNV